MSVLEPVVLPYVFAPLEGDPPAPIVEVVFRGPVGLRQYACLLNSGSDHSALPLSLIDDLEIPPEDLVATDVATGGGTQRRTLALSRPELLAVEVDGREIPIRPCFLLERNELTGEEWEEEVPVLGRDFFLGFTEVAFRQSAQEVHLRQ